MTHPTEFFSSTALLRTTPRGTHITQTLRDPREVIREELLMHDPIRAAVASGPATIAEIAERIGHPVHEVVYWVMGMRRYGHLIESVDADDDGFFSYGLVGQGPEATLEECEY